MSIWKNITARIAEGTCEDIRVYQDAIGWLRCGEETELGEKAKKLAAWCRTAVVRNLDSGDIRAAGELDKVCEESMFFSARFNFADFMLAMEYRAPASNTFYKPRAGYLKPMVEGYQAILDGNLDLLTVSMPKRAGKSTTEILFCLMLSGLHPERSILMEGTGDGLITSFYNGLLAYLDPQAPYNFYRIFPECSVEQTNADLKIINLNDRSRFPTLMCRSIDSRQVGLSEANNLLVLDDCVEGREEAKNRQRLDDKWEVISGDVMGRAIEGTPIVATGTRYSLYDPIGRLQDKAIAQHWKWKAVEIPALNENDESNYEYYDMKLDRKVFTAEYFKQQREMLSAEQWESEFQQQPFEAKGLLLPKDELNYYFELPVDIDPDTVVAVCDTAEGGGDSCAMPVAYLYGDEVYIEDVVFSDALPEYTKPECANMLTKHMVAKAQFESNNAGTYFAKDVAELVGSGTSITTKRSISNKLTRIEMASDGIKKRFYFKDWSRLKIGSEYWNFMKEVTTFTKSGKNKHDDAIDSLAMLENFTRVSNAGTIETMKRPW